MRYAEFSNGTKIIDGESGLADLHILLCGLGASRVMIVGDRELIDSGYLDKVKKGVLDGDKVDIGAVYLGDESLGVDDVLKDMYFVYMSNDCDGIIACGGGRLIDYAKLLRLAITTQVKDVKSFFSSSSVGRKVINVPLITVPVKFGIGNGCNAMALYYDREKKLSRNIFNDLLSPDYCIIDDSMLMRMSKSSLAYGVLNVLGRAIDGFVAIHHARVGIMIKEVDVYDIGEVFCRVVLTNFLDRAESLLEIGDKDRILKMALDSAYLAKGLDVNGMGMIYSLALAISDVKGIGFARCLPTAIKVSLDYNLRACPNKYAQALWAFLGWEKYSQYDKAKRAEGFVQAVKDFVDGVLQEYIPDHVAPQFTDDERQEIVTAMAYDPHMLNNPRHFDIFAIKAVLK